VHKGVRTNPNWSLWDYYWRFT